MASQLNLDRSDPGVDELVSQWSDGGKYRVTIDITQSKSSPSMNTFEVTRVEDLSGSAEGQEAVEAEGAAPPTRKPAKPTVVVEY